MFKKFGQKLYSLALNTLRNEQEDQFTKATKNIHTFLRENGFEIDSRWRRLPAPYCAAVKKIHF